MTSETRFSQSERVVVVGCVFLADRPAIGFSVAGRQCSHASSMILATQRSQH